LPSKPLGSESGRLVDRFTPPCPQVLAPLVVGQALYSLLYDRHRGWYAWLLSSLVSFVYVFGFAQQTPQLYVNYRLKSVAHLPWR